MSDGERGWPHEPVDRGPAAAVPSADPVVQSVRGEEPEDDESLPALRTGAFVALVVTLCLCAALASFSVVDWWSRNRELEVLLDRIAEAELAQRPMQVAVRQVQQSCVFTSPRCDLDPLRIAAASSLPQLQVTGQKVAATSIVRFHGPLRELRDRYVDHNAAWQGWLSDVAGGAEDVDQPQSVASTWYVAGDAALAAVPPFARGDARERVHRIFRT